MHYPLHVSILDTLIRSSLAKEREREKKKKRKKRFAITKMIFVLHPDDRCVVTGLLFQTWIEKINFRSVSPLTMPLGQFYIINLFFFRYYVCLNSVSSRYTLCIFEYRGLLKILCVKPDEYHRSLIIIVKNWHTVHRVRLQWGEHPKVV